MKSIYRQFTGLLNNRFVWLIALIISVSAISNAQINNSDFRVRLNPEVLEACGGNSNEVVLVKAKKSTLHEFNILFTLPSGIEYVSGTVAITNNPNDNYEVTYNTSSTLAQPEFLIRNTNGGSDANWGLGDELIFTFTRTASCDAVTFKENGGVFKDKHQINYKEGSTSKTAQDFDETISTYNLLSASLSITDIVPINGTVSNITTPIYFTRNVQDVQGGNGEIQMYHHEILVGADIYDYQFIFNGTIITPTSSSTTGGVTTLLYDIDLTQAPYNVATAGENGNQQFENGENYTFEEKFAVLGCQDSNITHSIFWDCGTICQRSGLKSGSIILGNQIPGLLLTQLEGSNEICDTNHFRVKIENTNTVAGGVGKDVYINIGLGHNNSIITSYDSNPLWAYDYQSTRSLSNVRFTNGPATIPTFNNPSTLFPSRGSGTTVAIPPNFLTSDPDGAGVGLEDLDNDGFYDDLAPGESTIIELDIDYNPQANCSVNRYDYIKWEHLYFDTNIKDQCYNPTDAKRLDFGYKNLIRDYQHVTELENDKDAIGGQAFKICIKPAMFSNMELNGHNALSANADSEFSVSINVPTGVSIDAANANAGLFTQTGNTITYTTSTLYYYPYILRDAPGVIEGGKLCFPVKLDCAAYSAA
ncbi:MAG TPA: hypothetical protein ENK59_00760, partial [Thioploca sp.]|nr:hypothetical protein [Thioploca sp.]